MVRSQVSNLGPCQAWVKAMFGVSSAQMFMQSIRGPATCVLFGGEIIKSHLSVPQIELSLKQSSHFPFNTLNTTLPLAATALPSGVEVKALLTLLSDSAPNCGLGESWGSVRTDSRFGYPVSATGWPYASYYLAPLGLDISKMGIVTEPLS